MTTVFVGKSTGDVAPMEFPSLEGLTVGKVLEAAKLLRRAGERVLVNGKRTDLQCPVKDQDEILLSAPIEGG